MEDACIGNIRFKDHSQEITYQETSQIYKYAIYLGIRIGYLDISHIEGVDIEEYLEVWEKIISERYARFRVAWVAENQSNGGG